MKMIMTLMVALSVLSLPGGKISLAFDRAICGPGDISYYPGGKLRACTLGNDLVINGVQCTKNEAVELYQNGVLRSCIAGDFYSYQNGRIICNQYSQVTLYPSGELSSCDLSEARTIEGKSCVAYESINLFENGKLKSCRAPMM
jgi:hypothetical protein